VAGNGTAGYSGDNLSAAGSQLNNPYSVAVDAAGNFYIADSRNNRIRKVTPGGLITTVAGNGNPGYSGDNGPATAAELRWPSGVALDSAGNLYIADYGNSRIRMVTAATGIITTVAGNGTFGYNGDNIAATSAELGGPAGLRLDAAGNLYIADQFNNRIRKVTAASGIITTVAGNGYGGGTGDCGGGYNGDNIAASSAELYCPADVALDGAGNLYIADYGNHRIRMVAAATSIITTVAGNGVYGFSGDGGPATSTQLFYPEGVALDAAGNLYIADSANYRLRMVTAATGIITTVAGNGTQGYSGDNGPANNAELDYPAAVVLDPAGNLYIADINNQRIRAVSVTTLPLGFAPTQINSNSATQTFRLANIGNAPLNLNGITPSPNFTGDASATTCSTSSALAAGDSCAVGVMFSPTTIGSFSGTLTLTDNALNLVGSTQQVNLAGIGTETTTVTFQPISPVNPAYGQTVSISVNVAAQSGLDAPSTGSVTFTVDGNQQPAIPLGTNGAVGLQLSGLKAGLHQVSANYGGSTDGNSLPSSNATSFTIAPAAPIITWASPATLTLGAALSSTQLNATSNVAGTFAYSPVSGTVLSAGLQTLSVTFTPTDVSDYKTAKAQVSLTVAGVAVSSPLPNSTVSSPVQLIASATPSSPVAKIKAMKVYVDNTVKYTADAASINTKLKLSKGSHHVTVQAWDALGTIYKDALVITVR
jgi:sugar lactone lactonase YvrE